MTLDEINASLFDEVKRLQQEVAGLENWKREATIVMNDWDTVWAAAGKPGKLGMSRAMATHDWIINIKASA